MITKIWTGSEQSRESWTKMINDWLKCCGHWYQKLRRGQEDRHDIFLWAVDLYEMITNIQETDFSEMMVAVNGLMRFKLF